MANENVDMARAWILSDLHCEFSRNLNFHPTPPDADILIACGDVFEGDVVRALEIVDRLRGDLEAVFVPGNHEHYGVSFEDVATKGREEARRRGIHYLDEDTIEIPGLRIAGAVLWEGIPKPDDADRPDLTKIMTGAQDPGFMHLPFQKHVEPFYISGPDILDKRARNADIHRKHESALRFLRETHADIIVTHYPPPLRALSSAPNARYWIHGHIHFSVDNRHGDTKILCNPRGGATPNLQFKKDLVISLGPKRVVSPGIIKSIM